MVTLPSSPINENYPTQELVSNSDCDIILSRFLISPQKFRYVLVTLWIGEGNVPKRSQNNLP